MAITKIKEKDLSFIPTKWRKLVSEKINLLIGLSNDGPTTTLAQVLTNGTDTENLPITSGDYSVQVTSSSITIQGPNSLSVVMGADSIEIVAPTTKPVILNGATVRIPGIPTASAGLASGDLWSDAGTIKIIP